MLCWAQQHSTHKDASLLCLEGVPKDTKKAKEYYQEACDRQQK